MPAKDKYHDVVIRALQKDGWTIVSDQVTVRVGDRRLWIDLEAHHQGRNIIFVEVKSYDTASSPIEFLKHSLGQYLLYRAILDSINYSDSLYLAIPENADTEIMQTDIGQLVIDKYKLNILVYRVEDEVITKWIHNL
ncbi:MAG: element excision factor XisH family protein [Phototrophicaceae bacterium]